jgi:hypothetical protein
MDREMASLAKNHTWDLEEPPMDVQILPGTWTYVKKSPPQQLTIYKVRWYVCGNRQQNSPDFRQRFISSRDQ